MDSNSIHKKILIVDDDLSIRFTLKKLLGKFYKVEIHSSQDGVNGLGLAYIIKPEVIIIDSTLPRYSGKEVVDFLITNQSLSTSRVIVLHEDSRFLNNLPKGFIQLDKSDKNFIKILIEQISNCLGIEENGKLSKITNFLSNKIIHCSNISNVSSANISSSNLILKIFNYISYLIAQFLTSVLLSIFFVILGRDDNESNIEQKSNDLVSYRRKIYPTLAIGIAALLFICIQITILIGGVITSMFVANKVVNAASYTWDGGGATENWSDCDNWSTNVCPVAADSVTFNTTSTKNSIVDASWGGTVTNITIQTGYSGTITLQRSLTVSASLSHGAGTIVGTGQTLSTSSYTLDAGTLTAPSVFNVSSTFNIVSGTFNHNSGTVNFNGNAGATLSCNNVTFNLVSFTHTSGTKTVSSTCSFPLGNNPTLATGTGSTGVTNNGVLSGSGTLTTGVFNFNTGSSLTGFSGISAGSTFTVAGGTANFGSYTSFFATGLSGGAPVVISSGTLTLPDGADLNSTLTISGGTFNAPSGTLFLAGALTVSGTPTFNHNNGIFNLDGAGGTQILSCNNITFNLVVFSATGGGKTINNNCNIPVGNNPIIGTSGAGSLGINLAGTITGTGTLTHLPSAGGGFVFNAGATLSGFTGFIGNRGSTVQGATLNLSGVNYASSITLTSGSIAIGDNSSIGLTISGGTFTAPTGNMNLSLLTATGGTFNNNGGTITLTGLASAYSCNNIVFNLIVISATGTKTYTNCTLPLGNNPSVVHNQVLNNSSFTGTGTLTLLDMFGGGKSVTMNAGSNISGFSDLVGQPQFQFTVSGATLDFSGMTSFTLNNIMTVSSGSIIMPPTADLNSSLVISGGTFTAPSGTLNLAGALTISGAPTFNHNNGNIIIDGTTSVVLSCNNVTFNTVTFSHSGGSLRTVNSNCNLPIGNNPTIGVTSAAITLNGTLTGSGTLTTTNGLLTLNSGSVLSGFNGLVTSTVGVAGGTINLSSYTTFSNSGGLTLSAGSLSLPNGADFNASLTITGGTFTAPSGNMTLAGALAISGSPTFNHNNGTITLDGTNSALTCNNVVFNLVVFAHAGTKTVNSSCTLPLGNNPNLSTAVTLSGTLSGTGTITGPSGLTLNTGAALTGFSGLNGTFLTIGGANIDFSSYSPFSISSTATLTSGSLTVPNNADFNGALSINGGTFNATSGTINLASTVTIAGASTFNTSSGTVLNFDGSSGSPGITCNNKTINGLATFTHTGGSRTIVNCQFNVGNNPVAGIGASSGGIRLDNDSTLTGSGKLTVNGNFYIASTPSTPIIGFNDLESTGIFTINNSVMNLGTFPKIKVESLHIVSGTFTAPQLTQINRYMQNQGGIGSFVHNNGTVEFIGNASFLMQVWSGSLNFYNLTVDLTDKVGIVPTMGFTGSGTQTIQGVLTLKGTPSNRLTVQNLGVYGSAWTIDLQGTAVVENLDVAGSQNLGTVIQAAGKNITDSGNNTGWNFNNPTITNISIEDLNNGFVRTKTPKVNFNISDPGDSGNVKYQVQIDNNQDFTSPEINYTSSLEPQGDKSFTPSSELSEGKYYLRIKGIDSVDGDGGFVEGPSFTIDISGPSGNVVLSPVTDSTNPETYIISSITDQSGVSEMIYSENPDFSGASYIQYKQSVIYKVSEGYGIKTIYIKFKDITGNESKVFTVVYEYSQAPVATENPDNETPVSYPDGSIGHGLAVLAIRILDQNKNPISNLSLKINNLEKESITDSNGIAIFNNIPFGKYNILGIYNDQEFQYEVEVTDNEDVVTIILEERMNNFSYVLIALSIFLGIGFIISLIYIILNRRKV